MFFCRLHGVRHDKFLVPRRENVKEYILNVMARDREGIVRDVSSSLAALDGNITHLSQTVLRGYFTLIISVEMPDEREQLEIKQAVERSGEVGELEVSIRPFTESKSDLLHPREPYTLVVQGRDSKGIIARTTSQLADHDINVDDFYCIVHEGMLLMLAKVSIPAELDLTELKLAIEKMGREFDLQAHLRHENIFRATNEVHSVARLERFCK